MSLEVIDGGRPLNPNQEIAEALANMFANNQHLQPRPYTRFINPQTARFEMTDAPEPRFKRLEASAQVVLLMRERMSLEDLKLVTPRQVTVELCECGVSSRLATSVARRVTERILEPSFEP